MIWIFLGTDYGGFDFTTFCKNVTKAWKITFKRETLSETSSGWLENYFLKTSPPPSRNEAWFHSWYFIYTLLTCNSLICFCCLLTRTCSSSNLAVREAISLSLRTMVCSNSFLLRSKSVTVSCVSLRSPSIFLLDFSISPLRNLKNEIFFRNQKIWNNYLTELVHAKSWECKTKWNKMSYN